MLEQKGNEQRTAYPRALLAQALELRAASGDTRDWTDIGRALGAAKPASFRSTVLRFERGLWRGRAERTAETRAAILRLIQEHGLTTEGEIAAALGLDPASVRARCKAFGLTSTVRRAAAIEARATRRPGVSRTQIEFELAEERRARKRAARAPAAEPQRRAA